MSVNECREPSTRTAACRRRSRCSSSSGRRPVQPRARGSGGCRPSSVRPRAEAYVGRRPTIVAAHGDRPRALRPRCSPPPARGSPRAAPRRVRAAPAGPRAAPRATPRARRARRRAPAGATWYLRTSSLRHRSREEAAAPCGGELRQKRSARSPAPAPLRGAASRPCARARDDRGRHARRARWRRRPARKRNACLLCSLRLVDDHAVEDLRATSLRELRSTKRRWVASAPELRVARPAAPAQPARRVPAGVEREHLRQRRELLADAASRDRSWRRRPARCLSTASRAMNRCMISRRALEDLVDAVVAHHALDGDRLPRRAPRASCSVS